MKIRELIENGELGEVYHVYASFRSHRSIPGIGGDFTIKAKAGANGRLFGSVTSKEIAAQIKASLGVEIDKKKIVLNDPIKGFGTFEVKVKLHTKVTATLKVKVTEEK